MITASGITEATKVCEAARADGACVGFVPTMGALHDGHRSLIRRARGDCDFVVVSIFVNPTQFGEGEDLDAYPRPLEADLEVCDREGVDLVFVPGAEEMYPDGSETRVTVTGLTETLEGAHRPAHFDGVALVCTKLFGIVGSCRAYFGEKDVQQVRVIERLVGDLCLPAEVIACPTVREPDGLALSSRNAYLSEGERQRATCLSRSLFAMRDRARMGEHETAALLDDGMRWLAEADEVDYLEIVDPATFEPVARVEGRALACGAIRIGSTRLIDNVGIGGRK